jgi:hypothetical protein
VRGALKAAVLVEDDALCDERRPWQVVSAGTDAKGLGCQTGNNCPIEQKRDISETVKRARGPAIEKAVAEFKLAVTRLMALRR